MEWGVRGGVSGDDVTSVITSSGPLKCKYFANIHFTVYGGSRCERVGERVDGWSVWVKGVSGDDVTSVITSSEPLKCEYFAYMYIKVYGGFMCERVGERVGGWIGGGEGGCREMTSRG